MNPRETKPTLWSMILAPLGIAAIMTPAILLAAGGSRGQGFDAIVRTIELRYHAHATRIPFMGLISGVAGIATHGGVRGLHVAEFEHFRREGDAPMDGEEFNALVEQHVGPGWQRIIRETTREAGAGTGSESSSDRQGHARSEQTLIYIRPDGNQVAMLVVDLDRENLDIVQLSVNPDHLMEQMDEHRHRHHDESPTEEKASPAAESE